MMQFLRELATSEFAQTILGQGLIAVVIWMLGQWAVNRNLKVSAIKDLMTYRGDNASKQFQESLNKITIVFHKDAEIRREVRHLYETLNNSSLPKKSTERAIVGLIYKLCQKNRFKGISEYDIDQSFIKASQEPSPSSQTPAGSPDPKLPLVP